MSAQIIPGQWQDGICSCFDDGAICAQTSFCHICTASSLYYREEFKFPTSCDCGSCCLLWCCSCCTPPGLMWLPANGGLVALMNTSLRRTLIARFGIQGETVCSSCLFGACCNPCTMCQVQREMKARNQFVGGICAQAPENLPAPAPQMNAPMGQPAMAAPGQPQQIPGQPVQNFNDWRSGLCGCVGCADCCEAYTCCCCVMGHMAGGLNSLNGAGGTMGQNDCAVCCCSCLSSCPCCLQNYNFMMRRELVERYAISTETICKSACLVCCCGPCTLAQARREMGYHGEFPGGLCMKEMPADTVVVLKPVQQTQADAAAVAVYGQPCQQEQQQQEQQIDPVTKEV